MSWPTPDHARQIAAQLREAPDPGVLSIRAATAAIALLRLADLVDELRADADLADDRVTDLLGKLDQAEDRYAELLSKVGGAAP